MSLASREYSFVDPTTFLSVNKFTKNLLTAGKKLTTAKYVSFISAAVKIAASFKEFQCLCADDLQRQIFSQRSCCS